MCEANTFKCFMCKETFEKGWSDEEAKDELSQNFPGWEPSGCDLFCSKCYEVIKRNK